MLLRENWTLTAGVYTGGVNVALPTWFRDLNVMELETLYATTANWTCNIPDCEIHLSLVYRADGDPAERVDGKSPLKVSIDHPLVGEWTVSVGFTQKAPSAGVLANGSVEVWGIRARTS